VQESSYLVMCISISLLEELLAEVLDAFSVPVPGRPANVQQATALSRKLCS